jgi:hypothetical protein
MITFIRTCKPVTFCAVRKIIAKGRQCPSSTVAQCRVKIFATALLQLFTNNYEPNNYSYLVHADNLTEYNNKIIKIIIIFLRVSYEYDLVLYGKETSICRLFPHHCLLCVCLLCSFIPYKKFGCQGLTYN